MKPQKLNVAVVKDINTDCYLSRITPAKLEFIPNIQSATPFNPKYMYDVISYLNSMTYNRLKLGYELIPDSYIHGWKLPKVKELKHFIISLK